MNSLSPLLIFNKTSRNWLLTFLVVLCSGWNPVKAQYGTWMYDAIPVGVLSPYGNPYFLDSRYMDSYTNYNNIGSYGPDMWYSFSLYDYTDLIINTCGSTLSTAVHVLDEYGNPIAYSEYSGCGYQGEIVQNFAPGNYYLVVEGSGYSYYNGYIQLVMVANASQPEGATISNPIAFGTISSCGGSFTSYQNNAIAGMGDEYGQPSPDIYYQFTLSSATTVTLSHCGSNIDTYMHLLDVSGNLIASNDDNYASPCPGSSAYIQMMLPAGTYYVVSEGGGSATGEIATTITAGSVNGLAGANMSSAIDAGTFSTSGNYSNTKSTTDPCLGNDYGQPSTDIYYKFVLTQPADVSLSHCGSDFDTYMHLLDASGSLIKSNDDEYDINISPCPGTRSYIRMSLAAGTYYLVSEGYSTYAGSVVSTINVTIVPLPAISYAGPAIFTVGAAVPALVPTNTGGAVSPGGAVVSTLAGSGTAGSTNGTGTGASFNNPLNTVVDAAGNIYVADAGNHKIRKVTPVGGVSDFVGAGYSGYADGSGAAAIFRHPSFMAIDAAGNIFVSDQQNNRIRKVTPSGIVTTFAGSGTADYVNGTGTGASFNAPTGLAFDAAGNLFVADYGNNRIRKITPVGVVNTFAGTGSVGAGNGAALSATFNSPIGLAFDASGNLYIADRLNRMVRKINTSGVVSTLAGNGTEGYADGTGTAAIFRTANNLVLDDAGNIYLADHANHMIRKITPTGVVTTFAGAYERATVDGIGTAARFNAPFGISRGADGTMYVSTNDGNVLRRIVNQNAYAISPALPAGLMFDNQTGIISGTPALASPPTNYTVTAYNAGGSSTTTLNIQVLVTCVDFTQDQNYVVTYRPLISGLNTNQAVSAASCDKNKVQTVVQYFDGLGRSLQTISMKGSADGLKDVVVPQAYDQYGREVIKYLPYASTVNNGSYKTNAITQVVSYYNTAQEGQAVMFNTPFAETKFELSPLNRVEEQGAPGDSWQIGDGHTIGQSYSANNTDVNYPNSGFAVRLYKAQAVTTLGHNYERALSSTAFYSASQLYLNISKDENWVLADGKAGTVEEYKDKEDHIILKRTFNRTDINSEIEVLSTYYVYDDLGNLSFVLPPGANPDAGNIGSATLDDYCYQYRYDGRKRLIEKKIPGKGWEKMVYNNLDQLVLSQDANHAAEGKWIYSKYDALGRQAITGVYNSPSSRIDLQVTVDAQAGNLWETRALNADYSNLIFPQIDTDPLTINYYDNYNFPEGTTYNYAAASNMIKGLLTGSKVKVLGTTTMLLSLNFYDNRGRIEKIFKQHYLSNHQDPVNYDEILNSYTFIGLPEETTRIHHAGDNLTTIFNKYQYDHMGRKLTTKESINSAEMVTLSKLEYNDIGQLVKKSLHSAGSTNFLQSSTYAYNERGWISRSLSDQFSFELKYNDPSAPQYNGNVSKQSWGAGTNLPLPNIFNYSYDKLNRLKNGSSTGIAMSEAMTYDVMGNITTLNRDGQIGTYHYVNGNKLNNITGSLATGDYAYDPNGNVRTDGRNGVTLEYNILNLPAKATKSGLNLAYSYDAKGNKLKKISNTETRHYISGIEYNGNAIEIIHNQEGVARNNNGVYSYEYNLNDHLGNIRYTFHKSPINDELVRLQQDDYYPFGMRKIISLGSNKYFYNGKELQEELGIPGSDGQYDYGARFYDPVIGRFSAIDPLSEKFMNFSGYVYAINNPINVYDPDGRDAIFTIQRDKNGNITGVNISSTIYIKGSGASAEKSVDLNKAAQQFFKSKESNGLNISFNVNYVYDNSKNKKSLKAGENLLEFSLALSSIDNRSHINALLLKTTSSEGTTFKKLSGNTGIIYDAGQHTINAVLHESMHLLGISDRYIEGGSFPAHKGFEKDIMGNPYDNPILSPIHYKSFAEAVWRFGGKSYVNNITIDVDSRLNLIHTPESDKAREERMKKILSQ